MAAKRYDKSKDSRLKREQAAPTWRYRAGRVVGRTPREQLKWLLAFAQQDFAALAANDDALRNATDQVDHFTLRAGAVRSGRLDELPVIDLEGFAIFVRLGLAALFEEGRAWDLRLLPLQLPSQNKTVSFVRSVRRESDGHAETRYLSSDVLMTARWRAQELVAGNLDSIGKCRRAACSKLFVINKRQEYCGRRCSGIERSAKLRAKMRRKDPERARVLRHEAYVRKVEREKDPATAKHVRSRTKGATTP